MKEVEIEVKVNKIKIPKIVKVRDTKLANLVEYKFIEKLRNGLLLYENTKTGCKQCFRLHDFAKSKKGYQKKGYKTGEIRECH